MPDIKFEPQNINEYVKAALPDFYEDNLKITEIGDGNINYVFKIVKQNYDSIIIKYAANKLRSSGRALDSRRIKIESAYLKKAAFYAENFVPEIYKFDEANSVIVMEDISKFKNLRKELYDFKKYKNLSKLVAKFLASVCGNTGVIVQGRAKKRENAGFFVNPAMCDISDDLVFTEPYNNYKKRNIIFPGEEAFVEKNIYADKKLKAQVDLLKQNFMDNAQCMLHGDLHSGSIFVNDSGIKILDSEFAFYGPLGYDAGNYAAHLIISLVSAGFRNAPEDFTKYLKNQIELFFDQLFDNLEKIFRQNLDTNYFSKSFAKKYLADIAADCFGYAGTEIIRRTVGDTKTLEIESLAGKKRRLCDKALINIGKTLIMERKKFKSGKDALKLVDRYV